ncbi:MAG: substrate import-associated zinc metallohydrolase lipoprotein [Marinifilaceae bacterium]
MKISVRIFFILAIILNIATSCSEEDELNYEKREITKSNDRIDAFMKEHFLDKFNCAIRWKWDDKFVSIDYYVSPPMRDVVIPTAEMIENFWIEPFVECSAGGKAFIETNFPPEIVFVGSEILNENGTETLGFAEAGVRITLTELDQYNLKNKKWLQTQLHTIHHEFTHIVHQTYQLPVGFEKISGSSYTGNSWTTLVQYQKDENGNVLRDEDHEPIFDHSQAIMRGVTTAYGTTNEYEDFAELVSNYIVTDKQEFEELYAPKAQAEIEAEVLKVYNDILAVKTEEVFTIQYNALKKALDEGKTYEEAKKAGDLAVLNYAITKSVEKSEELKALNQGKAIIMEKLNMTIGYYQKNFNVDLVNLRNLVQEKIVNAQK